MASEKMYQFNICILVISENSGLSSLLPMEMRIGLHDIDNDQCNAMHAPPPQYHGDGFRCTVAHI